MQQYFNGLSNTKLCCVSMHLKKIERGMEDVDAYLTSKGADFMIKDLAKGFSYWPSQNDWTIKIINLRKAIKKLNQMDVTDIKFSYCGWVSTFQNPERSFSYHRAITHMFNMTLSVFFNDFTALHHTISYNRKYFASPKYTSPYFVHQINIL